MTKYTEKQKVEAVKAYRKGTRGLRATAEAQGVGVDSLRAWVAAYAAQGNAGVATKKRSNYDVDFKLEVLRRMADEGLSCRQAAALFDVRRLNQIAEWSRVYAAHGAAALHPSWKGEQGKMNKTPRKRGEEESLADPVASPRCCRIAGSQHRHPDLQPESRRDHRALTDMERRAKAVVDTAFNTPQP